MGCAHCWLVNNRQETHAEHMSSRPDRHGTRIARVAGRAEHGADSLRLEGAERPRRDGEES
eukprot:6661845-Pyramimonas_sp.AAC.1